MCGNQLLATFSVCVIVIASGTSFGWIAPTLVKLKANDTEIPMTSAETSTMIAILQVGVLVSPLPSSLLADKFGRKLIILSIGPFYIVSWLIILKIKTFIALCFARLIQGLAVGIAFTVIPMYLGEIASKHLRGSITSFFQMAFYFGFLYEYVIGPFVSYDDLVRISMLIPVAFLILFICQPESPHYYAMLGKEHKAEKTLMLLRSARNPEDIEAEFEHIIESVKRQMENRGSCFDVVATPAERKAFLMVQLVCFIKMISGCLCIFAYATHLFRHTGFTLIPPYVMTIIMGFVLFVSVFFSTSLTDLIGRRPLLIVSTIGCAFSLGVTSIFLYFYDHTDYDLSKYSWVSPACIILYNLFLAFGLDPVSITYRSEMFPANTRAVANSLTTMAITTEGFLTIKLYQIVEDNIGCYFIFMIFSVTCFIGLFFIYFYIIETKNKSYPEILLELNKSLRKREDVSRSEAENEEDEI